jgi:hypothetical protein
LADLPEAFERVAPTDKSYHHDQRWGDGNGHAHIRAALIGPSLTVPFSDGRLLLGTWQQIFCSILTIDRVSEKLLCNCSANRKTSAARAKSGFGVIEISDITYTYSSTEPCGASVKGVSLTIAPGVRL